MKSTTLFLVFFFALSISIPLPGQPLFLYENFENGEVFTQKFLKQE